MEYDKTDIPTTYDRGRGYRPEVLRRSLKLVSKWVDPARVSNIVDLGCGTGRYSEPLAAHFDAAVVGVEPSAKMLAQAREKQTNPRVTFHETPGEALPIDDASTDLVFMSMVFHHLKAPAETAAECHRVLRPGGHVYLRNGTREQTESYPYVNFFPGVREIIARHLPAEADIVATFRDAGFEMAGRETVSHEMSENWPAFADKMTLRADSIVASLSEDAFEKGMRALRAHSRTAAPDATVTTNVDIFVFRRA